MKLLRRQVLCTARLHDAKGLAIPMQIPIRYAEEAKRYPQKEGNTMHDSSNRNDEEIIYAPLDDDAPVDGADRRNTQASASEQPIEPDPFAANPRVAQPSSLNMKEQASADNTSIGNADANDEMFYADEEEPENAEAVDMVTREEYNLLQQRYDRLLADWENYRRRTTDEIANAKDMANKNIVETLIPTVDNFSLALEHVKTADLDPTAMEMLKGFEAIQRSLLAQLEREGMEVISPEIGAHFDMMEHQAIERRDNTGLDVDSVVAVIQPGYKFKGAVLRPAMVSVAG